jgi:hypothetical protein
MLFMLPVRKLYEIHIGVCATPNTWCLVSVRVLNRGRIAVARANAERVCCSAFPNRFFVNFGNQPRIAVPGVPSIGEHLALGVLHGSCILSDVVIVTTRCDSLNGL